nr:hypothetical protein [Rickettsia endosymbiont of Ceutorhynchus assimilis]
MDDLIDLSDIEVEVPFAAIRADSSDAAELNLLRSLYAELEAYRQFEELEAKQSLLRDKNVALHADWLIFGGRSL